MTPWWSGDSNRRSSLGLLLLEDRSKSAYFRYGRVRKGLAFRFCECRATRMGMKPGRAVTPRKTGRCQRNGTLTLGPCARTCTRRSGPFSGATRVSIRSRSIKKSRHFQRAQASPPVALVGVPLLTALTCLPLAGVAICCCVGKFSYPVTFRIIWRNIFRAIWRWSWCSSGRSQRPPDASGDNPFTTGGPEHSGKPISDRRQDSFRRTARHCTHSRRPYVPRNRHRSVQLRPAMKPRETRETCSFRPDRLVKP